MNRKSVVLGLILLTLGFVTPREVLSQHTPVRGGIMKIIYSTSPRVLGYWPEMGPTDSATAYPSAERLMDYNSKMELEPFLAESVDFDKSKMKLTVRLRKGIKFHDGSDLNAEALAWNYRTYKETKKMMHSDKVKSIEVVDSHTVVLHVTDWTNQSIHSYTWIPINSKVAFEARGIEWCRTHPVGTGPFQLAEYQRDSHIIWKRNENYWQKGKPYLDGIEARFILDPMTASTTMLAGQADLWTGPPPASQQAELEKKGLVRLASWAGLPDNIFMNTMNPNAPTSKLKVREALEYALDKPALAKALGFGYYSPLKMMAPEGQWGYDPGYPGRPYDPDRAKKLLAEAGYPTGLKLKLLCQATSAGRNQAAEAIKASLDTGGFDIDVDVADPGRFFASVFKTGWDDLVLYWSGMDATYLLSIQRWFSQAPMSPLASFKRPQEFLAMCEKADTLMNPADQKEITKKLVRYMADEALVIPLWKNPFAIITRPYVHTDYLQQGVNRWKMYDMWMDRH